MREKATLWRDRSSQFAITKTPLCLQRNNNKKKKTFLRKEKISEHNVRTFIHRVIRFEKHALFVAHGVLLFCANQSFAWKKMCSLDVLCVKGINRKKTRRGHSSSGKKIELHNIIERSSTEISRRGWNNCICICIRLNNLDFWPKPNPKNLHFSQSFKRIEWLLTDPAAQGLLEVTPATPTLTIRGLPAMRCSRLKSSRAEYQRLLHPQLDPPPQTAVTMHFSNEVTATCERTGAKAAFGKERTQITCTHSRHS